MINWREVNEKFPKAFLEWVKTWEPKAEYLLEIDSVFAIKIEDWMCKSFHTYYPSIERLPYYFDNLGIIVNVNDIDEAAKIFRDYAEIYDSSGKFYYTVKHSTHEESKESFADRLAATVAGAIRAFEVRESQLNS